MLSSIPLAGFLMALLFAASFGVYQLALARSQRTIPSFAISSLTLALLILAVASITSIRP